MPKSAESSELMEAKVFAEHLLGKGFPSVILDRYIECIRAKQKDGLAHTPAPLTNAVLSNPQWIGSVDTFLGLFQRDHDLRQRLLILTALIETTPEYSSRFLSNQTSAMDLLRLGFRLGPLLLGKAFLGSLFFAMHRLKSRV